MMPELIRLECLKLVMPRDERDADMSHYVGKAKSLEDYVTGQAKRGPGRPRNADKLEAPQT